MRGGGSPPRARPVLQSSSRKHYANARNNVDHFRGDNAEELTAVRRIAAEGRFHSAKPRGFSSPKPQPPKQTTTRIRTAIPRPVDHVQRLLHGCAPTKTGPAATRPPATPPSPPMGASPVRPRSPVLRKTASFTLSADHPFSPLRKEAETADAELRRTASLTHAGLKKTASQRFWEANEPVNHGGVRTYNSAVATSRVLKPAEQPQVSRPRYRSESPTFRRSSTPDADSQPPRGVRTTIPDFVPDVLPRRVMTPTRRHPYPGGLRPSHVFDTPVADPIRESVERLRSCARRAATPPPPQRGRNELSLIDAPVVETPRGKRRVETPLRDSCNVSTTFSAATSVPRSNQRNRSTLSLSWN